MPTTNEKIIIGIDDKVIELKGEALSEFIISREVEHNHYLATIADRESKAAAKAVLLEKLGITSEEAALLLS
jgi:hypothetical protein